MSYWREKVAVVTGCSNELGLALAEELVKEGMTTIGLDGGVGIINEIAAKVKQIASGNYNGNLILYKCDFNSISEIENVFEKILVTYGGVDILINNAVYKDSSLIYTGSSETLKKIVDMNIYAMVACTRLVADSMIKRKGRGHIININDTKAYQLRNQNSNSVYLATKCAMTAINETLRHEFRYLKANVKVTNVAMDVTERECTKTKMEHNEIANIVASILNTPEHLQIHEIIMESALD